jgi:hypothetical protein
LLNTHTPLPSQTLEFLPIQPPSTETKDSKAQDAMTSFSLHQVAETQEPTTHSVAVTQEPAIDLTQELAIDETQEPTADFIPQIQELDDEDVATVAVTQEPTTHSVAKTQELAIAVTQEPATVETQELVADFILEIQESHAQGVATLFTLHHVAEKQDSTPDFVAAPQEPATEVVTTTQKPVAPLDTSMIDQQPEPTMASLLQENELLRS